LIVISLSQIYFHLTQVPNSSIAECKSEVNFAEKDFFQACWWY